MSTSDTKIRIFCPFLYVELPKSQIFWISQDNRGQKLILYVIDDLIKENKTFLEFLKYLGGGKTEEFALFVYWSISYNY